MGRTEREWDDAYDGGTLAITDVAGAPMGYSPPDVRSSQSTVVSVPVRAAGSEYRRDGFAVVSGVLDGATVATCTEHLHQLQSRQQPTGPIVTAPLASDAFLAGIAADPRLASIACCFLEAQPVPFGCTYIVKEPRSGLPVLWHQDGYPWCTGLGITEAVTLWIPLDPTGADNGGLRVIPGSHVLAAQPLHPCPDQPSVFGSEIDPALVDATLAHQLRLAPGDVSAHHPNLIHGSPPNRSDHPRRALAIRYRPL